MLTPENFWYFVYIVPEFDCEREYEWSTSYPSIVSLDGKVEDEVSFKHKEETKEEKLTMNELKQREVLKKRNQSRDELIMDPSFELTMKEGHENIEQKQKIGRNSTSNILRLFTKLLRTSEFKEKFNKVVSRLFLQVSFKEFNSWITGIGLNTTKYIRMKKILNGIKAKAPHGRILAMLYSTFVEEFARTATLTSLKTENMNIKPTLSQVRKIGYDFNEAVLEGYNKIWRKVE